MRFIGIGEEEEEGRKGGGEGEETSGRREGTGILEGPFVRGRD